MIDLLAHCLSNVTTWWRFKALMGAVSHEWLPNKLPLLIVVDSRGRLTKQVAAYTLSRYIYLSYFHPASKFPGPKLASISNLWLSYYQ
jgi:hypothetical protein